MKRVFKKSFINGVFPKKLRENIFVVYPDYEFIIGGFKVLVTHGHYLDFQQTLLQNLQEIIDKAKGDEAKAIREFL